MHLLRSASAALVPTLEVLVQRGLLAPCSLPAFEPMPELEEAWEQNGLSWAEIERLHPQLAGDAEELAAAFQVEEQQRRAGVTGTCHGWQRVVR